MFLCCSRFDSIFSMQHSGDICYWCWRTECWLKSLCVCRVIPKVLDVSASEKGEEERVKCYSPALCHLYAPQQWHLCSVWWFYASSLHENSYYTKHIRAQAQIHYQEMLIPSRVIQRIYWQTSPAACFIQRITEVLLYHYVSVPSVVLWTASDGTGVHWPHVFIQANNEALVQAANTARQYVQLEDDSSFKVFDIRVYGFNGSWCTVNAFRVNNVAFLFSPRAVGNWSGAAEKV